MAVYGRFGPEYKQFGSINALCAIYANGARLLFFSIIWGICFSFKVNPNGLNTVDKCTVGARVAHLLLNCPRPRLA